MASEPTNPGDEAAPGTSGTGENVCRRCAGSGEVDGGPCPECGGTGKVIEGIGGGRPARPSGAMRGDGVDDVLRRADPGVGSKRGQHGCAGIAPQYRARAPPARLPGT